jgi:tRNA pseudouridine55 synthase
MARRGPKRKGIALDGILLLDKPQDWTSHDVVGFVRGRYRLAKVGHGGTLDPMATGLLVLLLGKATKLSDTVMTGKKVYEGTITLGTTTNTQDAEGEIEETRPVPEDLTREKLESLLPQFTGDITQIPPMVSAIKKDGVALYKLARKGQVIERDPRPVTIHSYEITDVRLPEIDIRVVCSKGTYIRTLAHDFGQVLGCGAHLSALRRTFSGSFSVEDAVEVETLRDMKLEEMQTHLLPLPTKKPEFPLPATAASFASVPDLPLVLAVGAFDGLHLGHERVIQAARQLADTCKARTGVMRFFPHPSKVLFPDQAPALLCSEDQIPELLAKQGVHFHLRLPFTPQLAEQEPEAFLEDLFTRIPNLKGLVVGPNWHFGHKGRGDVAMLQAYAADRDIAVRIVEGTEWEGQLISSTRIREALTVGDLASANHMLDRHYTLHGRVRSGRQFGRELGFPTANFIPGKILIPPPGVYAMKVRFDDKTHAGAGYITHDPRLVEVHVLDFEGDLYGKDITVELISYQRPATPISDPKVLRDRIQADVEQIRELLIP